MDKKRYVVNIKLNAIQQLQILSTFVDIEKDNLNEDDVKVIIHDIFNLINLKINKINIDYVQTYSYLSNLIMTFTEMINQEAYYKYFRPSSPSTTTGIKTEDEIMNNFGSLGMKVIQYIDTGLLDRFSLNGVLLITRFKEREKTKDHKYQIYLKELIMSMNLAKYDRNASKRIRSAVKKLVSEMDQSLGYSLKTVTAYDIIREKRKREENKKLSEESNGN
jgi:hypothetical protein